MSWVPLHVHSQYSILSASASIKDLVKKAEGCGMPAMALTDYGNLYGAVDLFKACKGAGIKAILGCDFYVAPDSRLEKKKTPGKPVADSLVLLAKNEEGYRNLCRLSSSGFLEGFYYFPRIDKEILASHSEGLICLLGGPRSSLGQRVLHGTHEEVQKELAFYHELFGEDLYLELLRHKMSDEDCQADGIDQEPWLYNGLQDLVAKQEKVNDALIALSKEKQVKLVAANNSHYLERADWKAHEILLNVQSGEPIELWEKDAYGNPKYRVPNPRRKVFFSHECYFKSPEQMAELFSDVPEALSNTLEVADKCSMALDFETKHYPVFIPPDLKEKGTWTPEEQAKEAGDFLRKLCEEGIPERYTSERLKKVSAKYPGKDPLEVVKDRLEGELDIILSKGLCDYLLIVRDFIHWAKSNGIPMGPGRGSGAGSIILYLIGITDIEPLRFDLFFERFINPERLSYPDIDVDICMYRRGEVIDYTIQQYGKENVAQIITFGSMKAKMTIKDVGRVLNVPLAKVNAIAKLVPDDLNMTLEKALQIDVDLFRMYQEDEETKRILDLGLILEGSIRNTGIHAAGLIISAQNLTEHIPICAAKDAEMAVTQYSMKPVEAVGMLKMDFLGLKTLTSIQMAVDAIRRDIGDDIDWVNLPLDDEKTFQLLNQGKTLGVFQMESGGFQDLARQLHIDRFEEIIAVVALYRPGPMEMIPSYINRKHGREEVEYDHPWMKDILSETYGIMVYQEQVMQIACTLANYSLGAGDVLRRAMGKKDAEEMSRQREKFIRGAGENDIGSEKAGAIFDKMEKFASYGFNKSHAACYALLTYVTAYLKANYPRQWLAALMTCDRDDTAKVAKFIREAKAMGVPILPPDVNESRKDFVGTDTGIRFAMGGIKGVGEGVVEAILEERENNGPFTTFYSFFQRIDTKKVGKKVIEILVQVGCFDFSGWTRDEMLASVEPMFDASAKEQKEKAGGVLSLFGESHTEGRFSKAPKVEKPTQKQDILMREKELLGFFLGGHPLDIFKKKFSQLSVVPLEEISKLPDNSVMRIAAIIEDLNIRISSRNQKKFAILQISDGTENLELPIWAEMFEEKQALLTENRLIYAVVQVDRREGNTRISCQWLEDLNQLNESMIRSCDDAFDKAKMRVLRRQMAKDRPAAKEKAPEQKAHEEAKTLVLNVDASQARLSQVLKLKECFASHTGQSPVTLHFQSHGKTFATLSLDTSSGVDLEGSLQKELQGIPCVSVQS